LKKLKSALGLAWLGIFCLPLSIKAQPKVETVPEFGGWQWIWALFALVMVALLAYWTTRFLAGKYGVAAAKHLQVAESLNLGPNRQLHLLLVNDQVLLLGSSEHGLALLKEFNDSTFYQKLSKNNPDKQVVTNNFAALLSKLLQNEVPPAAADVGEFGRIGTLQEGFEKIKSWRRTRD